MDAMPMLSNPPAFVVLALVFAIAAYLRQVSEAAAKLRDDIRTNSSPAYPVGAKHTDAKLKALVTTREKLAAAAPWIIWLTIAIAFRFVIQGLESLPTAFRLDYAWVDSLLRVADLMIMIWIFVLLAVLGWMHKKSRDRDACIRKLEEDPAAKCVERV